LKVFENCGLGTTAGQENLGKQQRQQQRL